MYTHGFLDGFLDGFFTAKLNMYTIFINIFYILQVGLIVRGLLPVLRGKSVKARQEALLLLRELLVARPAALAPHVPKLIPALQYSLRYLFTI